MSILASEELIREALMDMYQAGRDYERKGQGLVASRLTDGWVERMKRVDNQP